MKILVVGTVSGLHNEGMRNVITHIARALEQEHEVLYAAYSDPAGAVRAARSCDAVIICARATGKVFFLCKLLERCAGRLFFLAVQQPDARFLRLNNLWTLRCSYLAIYKRDLERVRLRKSGRAYEIPVGIDGRKFRPLPAPDRKRLKEKYGLAPGLPVVLHVGHCSAGRGLEDFCRLDRSSFQRLIVVSGLFEDKGLLERLENAGIRLISEYLPQIEEMYQLADVYLFTTKNAEHVISVPLSVMEALSCGTPVVAYSALPSLSLIKTNSDSAVRLVGSAAELPEAVKAAARFKAEASYLADAISWDQVSRRILEILEGCAS